MNSPVWRKSSHSNTQGGDCVEVARLAGGIGVRDSKNPDAVLPLSRAGEDEILLDGEVRRRYA
ncbi:MAG TPA: DUF397 domain-containing protein [Streptosporangiaceae bacterium]|jgi:hypothetical protein